VNQRGFGFIEIVIVLVVVAAAGYLLMQYFTSTATTVEKLQQDRPLPRAKLAADQATLTSVQGLVRTYHAGKGQYPPDKGTVLGLLASPPGGRAADGGTGAPEGKPGVDKARPRHIVDRSTERTISS